MNPSRYKIVNALFLQCDKFRNYPLRKVPEEEVYLYDNKTSISASGHYEVNIVMTMQSLFLIHIREILILNFEWILTVLSSLVKSPNSPVNADITYMFMELSPS
jgi:hypothetical protein